ncbi:cell division protein DivIVA [Prauserella marina]|uniref:Cell wall synthesis protein Wag31 n=1 Tax=Prauserella marina TaxID=530584 RepID=A0A222VVX5_9PSEU|nr:DivIVA domain-containing protein [Prauserella marina]ASR38054.1 cell division protein DivIVA [Prauserella marina]PWV73295.1 DivIVA domain-containing protein [Prauserella marina]SDD67036.1 DivIVA domain-containing protein [Prauserella marina]
MSITSEDVRGIRFPEAPFGTRGYSEMQVDAFLDRVAATLDGEDNVTPTEVHNVVFNLSPLGRRGGYDQAEVDTFLRAVETTLAARTGTTPTGPYIAPALEHTHARRFPWPPWRR